MTNKHLFNHKVHVVFRREDLEHENLNGKVAIVLDVLFATSTIISALSRGAIEVIPTMDENRARAEAKKLEENSYILAGELFAETIEGFASPTPLALAEEPLVGRKLIYSTTNGTVALNNAVEADYVYVGALLNGEALVQKIVKAHGDKDVIIVCSGSMGNPNLEDTYGAGYLVHLFKKELSAEVSDYSDAANAAYMVFQSGQSREVLAKSRVGRMMASKDLMHELNYASELSRLDIVPMLKNGTVTVG